MRTAELVLKRLIVNGTDDPLWIAQHRADRSADVLDRDDRRRRARSARALSHAHRPRTVAQADSVQRRLAQQPGRPAASRARPDGQLRSGRHRRTAVRPPAGRGARRAALADHPERLHDALRILVQSDARRRGTSLVNFSYPIGTSPAEANLARARLQQRQTIAQTRAARAADRDRSHQRRAAGRGEPRAAAGGARSRANFAERRLEAEQSRFEVGLSTNFFVVQAQRDLRDAQNAELRALLDYRRAQVDFERVQEIPAAGGGGITTIQAGGGTGATRQRRRRRRQLRRWWQLSRHDACRRNETRLSVMRKIVIVAVIVAVALAGVLLLQDARERVGGAGCQAGRLKAGARPRRRMRRRLRPRRRWLSRGGGGFRGGGRRPRPMTVELASVTTRVDASGDHGRRQSDRRRDGRGRAAHRRTPAGASRSGSAIA